MPFLIRSLDDPTREYELESLEAFDRLYAPRNYVVASGPHAGRSARTLAAERPGATSEPRSGSDAAAERPTRRRRKG